VALLAAAADRQPAGHAAISVSPARRAHNSKLAAAVGNGWMGQTNN